MVLATPRSWVQFPAQFTCMNLLTCTSLTQMFWICFVFNFVLIPSLNVNPLRARRWIRPGHFLSAVSVFVRLSGSLPRRPPSPSLSVSAVLCHVVFFFSFLLACNPQSHGCFLSTCPIQIHLSLLHLILSQSLSLVTCCCCHRILRILLRHLF